MQSIKTSKMLINGRIEEPFNSRIDDLKSEPNSVPEAQTGSHLQTGFDDSSETPAKNVVIGPLSKLKGEISECSAFILHGEFEGSVKADKIVIYADGAFNGSAEVGEAFVIGKVEGDFIVHDRIVIRSSGSLKGNVIYKLLILEEGAELVGSLMRTTSADFDEASSDESISRQS